MQPGDADGKTRTANYVDCRIALTAVHLRGAGFLTLIWDAVDFRTPTTSSEHQHPRRKHHLELHGAVTAEMSSRIITLRSQLNDNGERH